MNLLMSLPQVVRVFLFIAGMVLATVLAVAMLWFVFIVLCVLPLTLPWALVLIAIAILFKVK